MLLLAAPSPSHKERAIMRVARQRAAMRCMSPIEYMPPWSSSTLIEREPEIIEELDDHDLLITDIDRIILHKKVSIRLLEAVLAFNQDEPFDAIFLKGLVPHVV